MSLAVISILVTGTISLLGVALSFYSINTQKALSLSAARNQELKAWRDRLRSIVSDHISLANMIFLAGDGLDAAEERSTAQRMTALEAEASILLSGGSAQEQELRESLPELRRKAIRGHEIQSASQSMPTEFAALRDRVVALAGESIRNRV